MHRHWCLLYEDTVAHAGRRQRVGLSFGYRQGSFNQGCLQVAHGPSLVLAEGGRRCSCWAATARWLELWLLTVWAATARWFYVLETDAEAEQQQRAGSLSSYRQRAFIRVCPPEARTALRSPPEERTSNPGATWSCWSQGLRDEPGKPSLES